MVLSAGTGTSPSSLSYAAVRGSRGRPSVAWWLEADDQARVEPAIGRHCAPGAASDRSGPPAHVRPAPDFVAGLREMPNSRHTSVIGSPSSTRATKLEALFHHLNPPSTASTPPASKRKRDPCVPVRTASPDVSGRSYRTGHAEAAVLALEAATSVRRSVVIDVLQFLGRRSSVVKNDLARHSRRRSPSRARRNRPRPVGAGPGWEDRCRLARLVEDSQVGAARNRHRHGEVQSKRGQWRVETNSSNRSPNGASNTSIWPR